MGWRSVLWSPEGTRRRMTIEWLTDSDSEDRGSDIPGQSSVGQLCVWVVSPTQLPASQVRVLRLTRLSQELGQLLHSDHGDHRSQPDTLASIHDVQLTLYLLAFIVSNVFDVHSVKPNLGYCGVTQLSRKDAVILRKLRIGHTRVTHKYLLSGDSQPLCDKCKCSVAVKHIPLECCSLKDVREKYFTCSSHQACSQDAARGGAPARCGWALQ